MHLKGTIETEMEINGFEKAVHLEYNYVYEQTTWDHPGCDELEITAYIDGEKIELTDEQYESFEEEVMSKIENECENI